MPRPTGSAQRHKSFCVKWLWLASPLSPHSLHCVPPVPLYGWRTMSGLAIRTPPRPFSPLCGIRPPIEMPHNEPVGNPGSSRPFLPLLLTSTPLGVNNNERFGDPDASGAILPIPYHSVGLNHNGRFGNPGTSTAFPWIVRRSFPHRRASKCPPVSSSACRRMSQGLAATILANPWSRFRLCTTMGRSA
jgi:hypothetical protein